MYAPASFKAARRETPAVRFFSGVDFSGEIPYHRSILSSAVRCGKWSEQDSREELLILSARRPSASPAPPAGSRGWQNWYSGKMEESGFDEVQTDRCGSVLGRIRGRRMGGGRSVRSEIPVCPAVPPGGRRHRKRSS